jgi:hypothetical protein
MKTQNDVPKRWSTRVGNTHKCKTDIDDDLSKAVAAKIIMATWNGVAADEIGINDKKVVTRVGKNHDLSHDEFDVPLNLIKSGTNTLYTHSTTTHHGIEVQWPGMVLMVTYVSHQQGRHAIITHNYCSRTFHISRNLPATVLSRLILRMGWPFPHSCCREASTCPTSADGEHSLSNLEIAPLLSAI